MRYELVDGHKSENGHFVVDRITEHGYANTLDLFLSFFGLSYPARKTQKELDQEVYEMNRKVT
jgi:hypothetical protein